MYVSKYYLDACIWLDYLEKRFDIFRPIEDLALDLIMKIINEKGIIIINEHLINELKNKLNNTELKKNDKYIPAQLINYIKIKESDTKDASKIKKSPK